MKSVVRKLLLPMVLWAGPALAADPASEGRALFARVGCYECHGYLGQGGPEGPRLAPGPPPLPALIALDRNTSGAMPAYGPTILSDADLQKIHAYLSAIKVGPSADSLALLGGLSEPQGSSPAEAPRPIEGPRRRPK